jgi:serine protease Do
MSYRRVLLLGAALTVLGFVIPLTAQQPGEADLNELYEKAVKEASKRVAPSIVQIQTTGGADMIVAGPKGQVFRKALGPTTGVIVDADGYIISSAFNFINNPSTITVFVPGSKEPVVAKKVATDRARMLTLLKIEQKNLPVPQFVANKDLRVGQAAIALGRTLDLKREHPPSVSVGIVSALGRIWGKAIQTDAKVSPVNYGGPIVDIQGRVQGILVPLSQRREDETAGFEWYDSGIGFAIPMEDVLAVVPKLKLGKDLTKGVLGVQLKSKDMYGAVPEVANVSANSAAARAGMKAGDIITEIDGKPVVSEAQLKHLLGPKYENDKVTVKFKRGKEEQVAANIELVGSIVQFVHAFLGILPMRDDPKLGVEIRYVYPKSPADTAGLKAGDRIVKYGADAKALKVFSGAKRGRDEFQDALNNAKPDTDLKLEVLRKDGKTTDTLSVKLGTMPGTAANLEDTVPETLPATASKNKGLDPLETSNPKVKPPKIDDFKKPEKAGLIKRTTTSGEHKFSVYVHDDYDPKIAHALLIWLHPPGKNSAEELEKVTNTWEDFCKDNHVILLMPETDNEDGWTPTDADFVQEAIRHTLSRFHIDRQRIVTHGIGVGGQMAFYLGFNAREFVRGVATTGAVMRNPGDNTPSQRLGFFIVAGKLDPIVGAIAESKIKLNERRFPVVYRELPNRGREYLDEPTFRQMVRWLDSLDRQ